MWGEYLIVKERGGSVLTELRHLHITGALRGEGGVGATCLVKTGRERPG
jgi:hypothetical protein